MRTRSTSFLALLIVASLAVAGAATGVVVGAYSAPVNVSLAGQDAWSPQVVSDDTTMTATWMLYDGYDSVIQASTSTDAGATWSTPVDVSAVGGNSWYPQIATDGSTITIVWRSYISSYRIIQTASSTDGGATWSAPQNLSAGGGDADSAQVVTDGSTITVVWQRKSGGVWRIQARSSTDGGATWGATATIDTPGNSAGSPNVVTAGSTITVAWLQGDGTYNPNTWDGTTKRVWTSSSADGGETWSTPQMLSAAGKVASGTQLVTNGSVITAIWSRDFGDVDRLQASMSTDAGATWSSPVNISGTARSAWAGQIVTDGATTTATWTYFDHPEARIQAAVSTDGGATWSTPVNVSASGSYTSGQRLVTDGATVTAVWELWGDPYEWSTVRVQTALSTDGGLSWSTPVLLSDAYAQSPALTTHDSSVTALWSRKDGSKYRVQASSTSDWFTDVPPSHPFHDEIEWLESSGITGGYDNGTFRPSNPVTRQAMSAFLYRADGSPVHEPPAVSPFSDVGTTHPFYAAITWMASEEISTGYDDGTFRSSDPVTRQAMSAFLYRAAGSPAHTPPTVSPFSDVATTHPFYLEITWMAESGISTGYTDGTFKPSNAVTRQAMAAFLQRMDALVV